MLFQQFISSMITDLFYVVSTGVNKVVGTARIMLDISIVSYHVEYIIFFLHGLRDYFLYPETKIHNIKYFKYTIFKYFLNTQYFLL